MNDLEQYEINALRRDALIDGCDQSGHPYPHTTESYEDGAKAVLCTNCGSCVEFINAGEAK